MTEFCLLFFVFVSELGLAAIVYLSGAVSMQYSVATFFAVYFMQFLMAPWQGGVSDHSLRKKSLLIAFNSVLIGQVLFIMSFNHNYLLIGTVILYGILGNITPIARAALADTELKKNFRLSIGLSTISIALGWIGMGYSAFYLSPITNCLIVTTLCFTSNFLVRYIKDPEDSLPINSFSVKKELNLLKTLISAPIMYWGLIGYLAAEIAFYKIFSSGKENIEAPEVRFVVATWVLGYIFGAIGQHYIFPKSRERFGMLCGTYISLAAMLFLIIFTSLGLKNSIILALTNSSFALGFGFFVPCLFSIVSERHQLNLQGKIYGLIDATDSLALMIAVLINNLPDKMSSIESMVFSSVLTGAALFCFRKTIIASNASVPKN